MPTPWSWHSCWQSPSQSQGLIAKGCCVICVHFLAEFNTSEVYLGRLQTIIELKAFFSTLSWSITALQCVLVSAVQREPAICLPIDPSWAFSPPAPSSHPSGSSQHHAGLLCVQRLSTSSPFCTWWCIYVNATLTVHPTVSSQTPPHFRPHVYKALLYASLLKAFFSFFFFNRRRKFCGRVYLIINYCQTVFHCREAFLHLIFTTTLRVKY